MLTSTLDPLNQQLDSLEYTEFATWTSTPFQQLNLQSAESAAKSSALIFQVPESTAMLRCCGDEYQDHPEFASGIMHFGPFSCEDVARSIPGVL